MCYTVFEKIIDLIIHQQNNSLAYMGKLPIELSLMKKQKIMLKELKVELKQHINIENYQKAAKIRDEIKKLKRVMHKRVYKIANRQ